MKIEKLEIKDYKQFKNLTLDLTYPKGHLKAGQPLDKICIIGQSGTGKTNLLEIINTPEVHLGNNIKISFVETVKYIYYYKVNNNIDDTIWQESRKRINNYNQERLRYIDTLSNKLSASDSYEKKDFIREREEWEKKYSNFLEKLLKLLNTILIKFNIQLEKVDENQESYNDLTFKDLSNENIIKYDNLSTGTKNLIATFIPLKIKNPKDSIILIDEPENSFYPDIQRMLTELYMEVGENNQLVFATHSPLIASSFEPWEVVELKFDKNNQVYRELYYEGENHINNYTLDPRMLTWTGILMDIFDIKESSNSNLREQKIIEFNILKEEIKSIDDIGKKEELFKKLQNMGKKLGIYNR